MFDNHHNYTDYEEEMNSSSYNPTIVQTAFSALMRKVYLWMTFALVVTGLTALVASGNQQFMYAIMSSRGLFLGLIIAEVAMVITLSAAINRLGFMTAGMLFIAYSILNGLTMSFIFLAYTDTSIATTFFVTAGTFAAMSFYGYFTENDLTSWGRFLLMALIGLIIAAVVNMFMGNSTLDLIISCIGVLIFVGLTAYDTQKIKRMFLANSYAVDDQTQKLALLGSLTLYLDFVNLFLYLLRFLGRGRE